MILLENFFQTHIKYDNVSQIEQNGQYEQEKVFDYKIGHGKFVNQNIFFSVFYAKMVNLLQTQTV